MPRKSRIDAPGALQHIIIRGIEKKKIFLDQFDRENFIKRFGSILTETSTPCFAWVLMPNHSHLLLMTGLVPIATIMRRLLTGYAQAFNRRHNRHGHLFQNRYKSILCQEDPYLLELVRYIHLNPLRARMVKSLENLKSYSYSGHAVIMGKLAYQWQDSNYVLSFFGKTKSLSRRNYLKFIAEGADQGRRDDLAGGGLIRSSGGWSEVKSNRLQQMETQGDERILGNGEFVARVLKSANEELEQRTHFKGQGFTLDVLLSRVATHYKIKAEDVKRKTKNRAVVKARSVFCYLAVRELLVTGTEVARKVHLTQPAVSKALSRGELIARSEDVKKILFKSYYFMNVP
jgi:REP element-mobilizing transposase RayT